jgi:predicted lipoprotein with Yx(FWY)xxD motif
MNKAVTIGAVVVVLAIVAVGAYLLAGNGGQAAQSSTTTSVAAANATTSATTTVSAGSATYTVTLRSNATVGEYLANDAGFTLYVNGGDKPGTGTSSCYGQCASNWPAFYAANLSVAPGLSASAFGTIARTDGTEQLTYKGYPLYLFASDHKPGEIAGQGVGGFTVATK